MKENHYLSSSTKPDTCSSFSTQMHTLLCVNVIFSTCVLVLWRVYFSANRLFDLNKVIES